MTIETVKPCRRSEPHVALAIFHDAIYLTTGQTILGIKRFEQINSRSGHRQRQQQKYQKPDFLHLQFVTFY